MKARGKGSIGFAGNGNGGLYQSSGRNAFDGGRDGALAPPSPIILPPSPTAAQQAQQKMDAVTPAALPPAGPPQPDGTVRARSRSRQLNCPLARVA